MSVDKTIRGDLFPEYLRQQIQQTTMQTISTTRPTIGPIMILWKNSTQETKLHLYNNTSTYTCKYFERDYSVSNYMYTSIVMILIIGRF